MNKVLLTGRLTRDPELRSLASGKSVTTFNVATNQYTGGTEKSEYHTVVTWDKLAQVCGADAGPRSFAPLAEVLRDPTRGGTLPPPVTSAAGQYG